jgi:hypothetical protein
VTNWAAIGIIAGAELTVLFAGTLRCFTARARLDRDRDSDIRGAIAGYEAGQVVPALAALVSNVNEVKADDVSIEQTVEETLERADTAEAFQRAVDAAIMSRLPRARERTLIHRYTALGVCLIACHLAGPAALYNVLTAGYNLPSNAVIVATVIFSIGAMGMLALAVLVGLGEARLARAIREGKDAA